MPYPGPENPPAEDARERALQWLTVALLQRSGGGKDAKPGKLRRIVLASCGVLNWGYLIGLVAVLVTLQMGFVWWPLFALLFLPQQGWLLPLLVLVPLNLLCLYRRGLVMNAVALLLVLGPYLDYNVHPGAHREGPGLTIVTNNRGESNHTSITPYLEQVQPDIIAYQDQDGHGMEYAERYPEMHVASEEGLVVISRYEVQASGKIPLAGETYSAGVGWFQLDYEGQPIKLFVVHNPSPRDMLLSLQGRGFLYELFGLRKMRYGDNYKGFAHYLKDRRTLIAQLTEILDAEPLPYLVVGDFNMPDRGILYKAMVRGRTDAFEAAGNGYGHTFPGTSSQKLTLFGPWLRLDYIFASPQWRVEWAEAEPRRHSQHRAVTARLTLPAADPAR